MNYIVVDIWEGQFIFKRKAIGVKIKRSDGVHLPQWEYFPLSQVEVALHDSNHVTLNIPEWLYSAKLGSEYSIVTT